MPDDRSIVVEDPLLGFTVGGYRIEKLLGAGGMGLVYQARHELIDRRFAVKVLRPEVADDKALAKNFHREAQTLSALKHPNVIDIVGFGPLPDGREYMVMEFLEGHTLEDELAQGQLGLLRALGLAEQVLNALAAAHSVEVIHRDLKPSNVFLSRGSGGSETVKLLDFGLAKQQPVALALVQAGDEGKSVIAGTPEYVAPEQASGEPANAKSDLYSFGVMFFEMLTGRLPFNPGSTVIDRVSALLRAHLYEEAPTLEQVGVTVPESLSTLIRELLAKKPSDRPESAVVVRARLAAIHELVRTPSRPNLPVAAAVVAAADDDAAMTELALGKRRGMTPWVALLVLLLLGLGGWLVLSRDGRDAAPAPVVVAVGQVPSPEPSGASPTVDGELARLEALTRQAQALEAGRAVTPPPAQTADAGAVGLEVQDEPQPPKPRERKPTTVLALNRSDCEPDERWRAAARTHLQEIQQLAAGGDAKRWAEFERLEPTLTMAIDSAETGAQCDAVEQHIRRLAASWRK